ncbi:hypothetical protein PGTUg99_020866 [Puccinia graminis f. sp. tritici]|uniref:Uncharacterized protein n=1 Tax=Puccinia graminis f. sp. tritici TaxID=56615 RepID=A0A5B0NUB6_PUCGR|nr:hypothetical protein PGTUg99_020866 [Puccinia graminis f. sp. tritici]
MLQMVSLTVGYLPSTPEDPQHSTAEITGPWLRVQQAPNPVRRLEDPTSPKGSSHGHALSQVPTGRSHG